MARIFTFLLLFCGLTAPAQPINWDSVRADYITKYQPLQVPAWLFPIIFEEGGGQRDTIYLGYDEDASWRIDSLMGEKLELLDTTRFNSCWGGWCLNFDSVLFKIQIDNDISSGFSISFYKGILPLKMYWDRGAFYSDSLPFPDQGPAPRAQGILGANMYSGDPNGMACPGTDFVLLSDTSLYYGRSDGICTATDSLVFFDILGGTVPSFIWMFKIVPWTGFQPLGVKPTEPHMPLIVFPNPTSGSLNIQVEKPGIIQLIGPYGQVLEAKHIDYQTMFDLGPYPAGTYFVLYNEPKGQSFAVPIILTK